MAFILHSKGTAGTAPIERLTVATSVAVGDALTEAGAKATGAVTPAYVAVGIASGNEEAPVIRITDDMVFESKLGVQSASIAIGTKYTIHTDAASVTATTTSGVCEVVAFDGTAAGSRVLVRF